ncbi:MAG: potassium transporter TrkG [Rhodocyclaceae bacterium]|nr:potassium transporter TrkG [Rhodocyclaceae bacterium]MDZ4214293.1 potassium transporter TrkG [Rhodocyclaceae bacterium]
MRFLPVFRALGVIISIFGIAMLAPLGVSISFNDGAQTAYDEAIAITLFCGLLLWLGASRGGTAELRVRDGFLLVALTWTILPFFGALPLLIHLPGLSFTDAYFEATSGLTATGSTLLSGLDHLPISINFWRTFMHWLGGLGVIVLAVAILPLLGIGGRQLFKAEVPGPMKESSLTPRIAETARGLWVVYIILTIACALAFIAADMEKWDALMHAFSVMGLGGFSTKDASLGHFNSLSIELIAMGFALLSGINYATHFLALHQRSPRPYLRDAEIPFYLGVMALSIVGLTAYLMVFDVYESVWTALRYVAFHCISLATSLGFATTDYAAWPMFGQLWILFLGSFYACSGSTGGGIKMMRAIILYKQVNREILRAMHPRAVHPVRLGGSVVPDGVLHAVLAFSFIYMAIIVSLTLLMSASGLDIVTAFSAIVATLNNTGPGLGEVGPASNFSSLTDFQTWVCSFAMVLGRLELFTLLVVLSPAFWRK